VFQAYGELERQGLIEARPQSGFFVRARQQLPEPLPDAVPQSATPVTTQELTLAIISAGRRPAVALDAATPAAALLPTVQLGRSLARAARRGAIGYEHPPGRASLRRELARRSVNWGCHLTPDEFVITTGATEALGLALRAVGRAGDTIAVESPTYYGVLQTIESLGMRVLEIPTSAQDGLSLSHLERALQRQRIAACFAMPNFANPLGSAMSDERKQALVDLLRRAHVPLIEDDVAGDVCFLGPRPRAAKSFDTRGLVLYCSSASKTLAPGFRVGWMAPGRFRERVIALQWASTIATSTPAQLAIADYLSSAIYDRHLRRFRAAVSGNADRMGALIAREFPDSTAVTRPRGGLVLWVELPRRIDSMKLHALCLRHGIAIMPGTLFSPRPIYRHCIRLSCGVAWSTEIERALALVGQLARRL
jgi:DNA-binding transcriptional MocR family regulator